MRWAVRRSFRDYIASVPDGKERVSEGARIDDDGRVVFPPAPAELRPDATHYGFRGKLSFAGHGGVLSVELGDIQVLLLKGGRSTVSVAPVRSRVGDRPVIATFVKWEITEQRLLVPEPRLTWSGSTILGDVYEVGDLLDPIEIELPGS